MHKINTINLYNDLQSLTNEITTGIRDNNIFNNNYLNNKITDGIYKACMKNKKGKVTDIKSIPNNENCTSKNYKAIAEANYLSPILLIY